MANNLLANPSGGQSVLQWVRNELAVWTRRNRIVGGRGVSITRTDAGTTVNALVPKFSGIVYLAGKKFDLRGQTPGVYVKVDIAAGTVAYTDTAPADPFPPSEEYYEVAQTFGHIHVPRFG